LFGRVDIKKSAIGLSPLFIILIGAALVAFSLGPFQNFDSQLEFEAASNLTLKVSAPS
jgi:hypothetical protein